MTKVVDIDVDLVHETGDAYLVKTDEDTFGKEAARTWVPKSLSEYYPIKHNPTSGTLTVEEWFAINAGLV